MTCDVYVDFDGTIAPCDPTDRLFDRFADPYWRVIEAEWQAGGQTSRDCMQRQVALLRATPEALDAFLAGVRIDPEFPDFVRLCAARGCNVLVVSDGLDRVVSTVLARAGLDLPFVANRLEWQGGDRWALKFPHARGDCRSRMGNCKCGHLSSDHGRLQVLVGDGRSDFCLSERSHLVLAKGRLAEHCRREASPHVAIRDFADATQFLGFWFAVRERIGGRRQNPSLSQLKRLPLYLPQPQDTGPRADR